MSSSDTPTASSRWVALAVHQCPPRSNVEASVRVVVDAIRTFRDRLDATAGIGITKTAGVASAAPPALIVFAELFLGGYGSGDALTSDNVTITPPLDASTTSAYHGCHLLEPIRHACRQHRVAVVVGYSERCVAAEGPSDGKQQQAGGEGGGVTHYNAALVVNDDGVVVASYRKVHLWGSYEASHFSPSANLLGGRFTFHGISCGVLICFDVEFPESTRTLRLDGAEVVLVPTALVNAFNARVTVPSRAFENNVIVCYANEVGGDPCLADVVYCGQSVIALPDGREGCRLPAVAPPAVLPSDGVVGEGGDGCGNACNSQLGFAIVDLDSFDEARRRNNYLEARRPECYRTV
jgi:5-aminopentanamidase